MESNIPSLLKLTTIYPEPKPWSLISHYRSLRNHHNNIIINNNNNNNNSKEITNIPLLLSSSSSYSNPSFSSSSTCNVAAVNNINNNTVIEIDTDERSELGDFMISTSLYKSFNAKEEEEEQEIKVLSPTVSTTSFVWSLTPLSSQKQQQNFTLSSDNYKSASHTNIQILKKEDENILKDKPDVENMCKSTNNNFGNTLLSRLKQENILPIYLKEPIEECFIILIKVLEKVRTLHLSQCPLCGPVKPPNWWKTVRECYNEILENNNNNNTIIININNSRKKRSRSSEEEEIEEEEELSTIYTESIENKVNIKRKEKQQQQQEKPRKLREEIIYFLEHVYTRRKILANKQPLMYEVSSEEHILRRECDALGGIALLEALLLGFC